MYQTLAPRMGMKAALCGHLTTLAGEAERLPPALLAERIEDFRRVAVAEGIEAADRICRAFADMLAESRARSSFAHWFAVLGDAVGCESADPHAVADACLAALMVRRMA